jgi:hypothetical protein
MPLTICYVLLFDLSVGFVQASLRQLSVTHHVRSIAGIDKTGDALATSVIAMAVIAAIWTALALLRVRRLEA